MPYRRLCLALLASGWILLIHMMLSAGAAPVLRTARVALPDWPAGTPPLRIALISDLHTAWPGDSPARLARTADRIAALHPDLLVVAGDVLSNGSAALGYPAAASVAPLARIRARLGCVAVFGNHDYGHLRDVTAALAGVGCTVLDNRAVRAGPLAMIGVADSTMGRPDLPGATARGLALGGVPVLVTHNPTPIYRLGPNVHLALAGHTHCGQLVGVLRIERRDGRYSCGVVREPERQLTTVVGAGLGASNAPIRLGVPPDFWLLTVGG